jgi:hypothetical protein
LHIIFVTHNQGTYEAVLTGDKLDLTTDNMGAFEVANPQLGLYRFSSALEGSQCTDAITGVTVRFPFSLYVPPVIATAINAISLLTVPVADDATVTALYKGKVTDGRAPQYLWTHAYKLFGYDATKLAVSLTSALWVSVWDCDADAQLVVLSKCAS